LLYAELLPACYPYNITFASQIFALSLHDALPICDRAVVDEVGVHRSAFRTGLEVDQARRAIGQRAVAHTEPCSAATANARQANRDRKSARLNSTHVKSSYAVFWLNQKPGPHIAGQ